MTELGGHVFAYCGKLEQVILPETLTKIGLCAFSECSSLTELRIPASVIQIDNGIAKECDSLKKITVDSADYEDVAVFTAALCEAITAGKEFLFRCAAALPKVLGGVEDRPLLRREDLVDRDNRNGGIILVGSHVNKTTRQLEALRRSALPMEMIEFNQHRVLEENGLEDEVARVH